VRQGGYNLAPAGRWQVCEYRGGDLPRDVRKGVAVEEKEGCPAVAVLEEV
jgi:hypothetical protein